MTPNLDRLYSKRLPSRENAKAFIGDGTELIVDYIGSVDLIFHSPEDVQETLECVYFISSLKVHLLSLHTIQVKEAFTFDATAAHLMSGWFCFPQDGTGSRLNATRRPPPLPPFLPLRVHRL